MKIKKAKLEWYAFQEEYGDLVYINVLEALELPISKEIRKGSIVTRVDLKKWLKGELMFKYWCKCEREVIVVGLFSDKEHKIDVWYQLEPNLERILDHVIKEMELEL